MHVLLSILLKFLSLYLGVCTSLGSMSWMGVGWASFLYRLLMSYLMLVVCAAYGATASLVLRLAGMQRIAQWMTSQAFRVTMRAATGVRFEVVSGQQYLAERPAVLVSNHQTALDVLMLAQVWPRYCSVTAKKQLKMVPFLGWFMTLSGTVFIDRTNRSNALKAFEGAATEMRQHRQSVFIFPEGTRSNPDRPMLLPFKKGAFHLAVQAKVPIVPIVTACYWGVLAPREWRFRRGNIPIMVLPPIPTENLESSDVEQLTVYVRERMLKALIALTESPVGQQAFRANPPPMTTPMDQIAALRKQMVADAAAGGDGDAAAQAALLKKINADS